MPPSPASLAVSGLLAFVVVQGQKVGKASYIPDALPFLNGTALGFFRARWHGR